MQLQTIESSLIQAVSYDKSAQTLELVFNSGNYQYHEPGIRGTLGG